MSQPIKPPSLIAMAKNLAGTLTEWATKGFPTPNEDELKHRLETCAACPHWDAEGFGGLGRCARCGCGRGKLFIKTAKCPDNHW